MKIIKRTVFINIVFIGLIFILCREEPVKLVESDFHGSNYPSGIYFYSLEIDGIVFGTKKMVLIK